MTPRERNRDQIDRIAFWHGIGVGDVMSRKRSRTVVNARRDCAVYFRSTGKSFPAIGRILDRDHTTILYLVHGKAWKCLGRGAIIKKVSI